MTMPIDLVLVRHGESEANAAKRRAQDGDASAYNAQFRNRHTRSFRLTARGRDQAAAAGQWLTREFLDGSVGFDRYITSEYVRAMETAGLLSLPGAVWFRHFYLTERDWGDLELLPPAEREEKFGAALAMRDIEPFFWTPPNGESFATLCLRLDRVLYTLHRECSDKRVLIVCHGEVMWAFRVLLERMSQTRFKKLHLSKDPDTRIDNCQVLHYTRRNPETGELARYANWMRMVRPTQSPIWKQDWQTFVRPRYTNDELLKVVARSPGYLE